MTRAWVSDWESSEKRGDIRTEFPECFQRIRWRAPGGRKEEKLRLVMLTLRRDTVPKGGCDSQV